MKDALTPEYTLLLLTSRYPFGNSEPFIENETGYLVKNFRKIIIISQDIKENRRVALSDGIQIFRYNPTTPFISSPRIPILVLKNFKKAITLWQSELQYRKTSSGSLSAGNIIILAKRIIKTLQLCCFITRVLKQVGADDKVLVYSYWLNTGAHAAALFDKPEFVKIARAHGSDLYEEKSPKKFLPLLSYCAKNLDSIFFVSEDGLKYFSSKYPEARAKLTVSRLGVSTALSGLPRKDELNRFVIVSCSNIIPLKRIDLIIKSLAIIRTNRKMLWIHYGEGYLKDEIVNLASSELGKMNNIEYQFRGQVSNEEIMNFYSKTLVDLFINTSSTEGLPVSIMEAQLHGIPALATDVGGVRELVTKETGKLLSAEVTIPQLASAIDEFINMPSGEAERMRESCRQHCIKNFDAGTNYSDFILKVNSILASRRESEM